MPSMSARLAGQPSSGVSRNAGGIRVQAEYLTLAGIVALGAGLRIWQYAANGSLWLDEVSLAMGILQTDLSRLLTEPLPYDQVAPKGFLLLQKLAVLGLGPSDYALRLVPFVFSLIALVSFAAVASRMLDGVGAVAAVVLFATAAPLISYSAVVKQYAVDVCVAVLLWWLAWELTSQLVTTRRALGTALAGAILVWLSQPAVLMLAAFITVVLAGPVLSSDKTVSRRLVAVVGVWGVSALAVSLAGLASMTSATREYMLRFWAAGFPPTPLSQVLGMFWPWDRLMALLGSARPGDQAALGYPLPMLYAVLAAAGLGFLWRRNRRACLLLTAPLAITLGAAVAEQYPFSDRLILFLVPGVILAIAAAVEGLCRLVRPLSSGLAGVIAFGMLAPAVYPVAATPPVYLNEHMKPILALVQAERRSGDGIYVYYGAAAVVAFYAPHYGLDHKEYSVGGCHRGDTRRYLQELDTFRGRSRVWLLITHSLPRYREREDIVAYLDTIGTRMDSLTVASRAVGRTALPAEAYLYDLSDPEKTAIASAATFTLSGSTSVDPRVSCGDGPLLGGKPDFSEPPGKRVEPTAVDKS